MPIQPLTTQIVGSYTKPHWLARHLKMRALDGSWWRPDPEVLADAKHDAALLALYEQERAGLDLVNDGEAQRASYDRHFLRCLTGIDYDHPDKIITNSEVTTNETDPADLEEYFGHSATKARVVSEISWAGPLTVDELIFTKAHASRPIKANLIGPITLAGQVSDHAYGDEKALAIAIARALNQELRALQSAGADVLQIDEPYFHTRLSAARRFGKEAIEVLVQGIEIPVILHVCYGYALSHKVKSTSPTYPEALQILADCPIRGISLEYEQPKHNPDILRYCGSKHIVLGLLDLANREIETPEHVAARLQDTLAIVPPERLHPCSDCGMWYLPRPVAFGKISALVAGTNLVRQRI
ncbi:hypothetical protein RFM26_31360 [Mesorhizobium sp. VK23B]|uniref:Cobalamin-independent methionine synthase MetE C-terminal/archaeal domain-containing protein n=1 Tax=Mesorhizobium dulcispinae TaxID=3072316 RepID=A0ABU4XP72_9HYPH|nr:MULTISPECIES: hypothetical protein [unclassified Mesorhizobium]MDX8470178.1 hypothetical protein [Mesorhizobium sp. VK23B]MDX8476546.1 hypothetical protein [Mesorhizobium sp. VK23A]